MAEKEAVESEEEELIEIAEEADLIQEERIIEDNFGPRGGRDGKKKGVKEHAVRAIEELMLAVNLDAAEKTAEQSEERFEVKSGDFSCGECNKSDLQSGKKVETVFI